MTLGVFADVHMPVKILNTLSGQNIDKCDADHEKDRRDAECVPRFIGKGEGER